MVILLVLAVGGAFLAGIGVLVWKAVSPKGAGEGNPWSRRVFYLLLCVVVIPVALLAVGLMVPMLAYQSARLPKEEAERMEAAARSSEEIAEQSARLIPARRLRARLKRRASRWLRRNLKRSRSPGPMSTMSRDCPFGWKRRSSRMNRFAPIFDMRTGGSRRRLQAIR